MGNDDVLRVDLEAVVVHLLKQEGGEGVAAHVVAGLAAPVDLVALTDIVEEVVAGLHDPGAGVAGHAGFAEDPVVEEGEIDGAGGNGIQILLGEALFAPLLGSG